MASACLDCLAFPCQWVTLSNPGLSNLRALSGIESDTVDPKWRPSRSIRQPGAPFLLMCATVSWMSCIVRLTQNGYILCISSCLGGSPLSKSSGVLMGAPNITS
ncbi:Sperm flagellar protein 2 [Frankliniella fusca]|uniref:Sperm flagellar protein 2 n=1 Tax=Frankliniella fusca TaxID=407009 RepID=A0AAE1HC35_9NEOP|nr:Sperm flagellar protein 2 [Frankliniella fusca]